MTATSLVRTTATLVIFAVGTAAAVAGLLRQPTSGLVIISLDTTRADRLPAYGFDGVATPAIDALASRGVVFDQTISVAPLTLPAHTSLFTGLYPPNHGVRDNADRALDPAHPTLAAILHDRGFVTAAFVGSTILNVDRGLSRGFDVYDDGRRDATPAPLRRAGSDVVDRARDWIDHLDGRPFFLWVHLYDVHASQTLPMEFRRAYGDRYEGGIAYVDAQIGRLIAALGRRNRLSKTAIVVVGDHGESLGEHGETAHGIFLYESTLHVPFVFCAPGVTARRVAAATSLVDIVPTVLHLFGIPTPASLDGVSLMSALHGGRVPARPIYAESLYGLRVGRGPLRMVREGQLKFIDGPPPELYDLDTDPSEGQNLATAHIATVTALQRVLQGMNANVLSQPHVTPPSADRLRALAALGYVGR